MANRAYLRASISPTEEDDDFRNRDLIEYYDSRHNIPLSWYFFFHPEEVTLDWRNGWPEIIFSAERITACNYFASKIPIIKRIFQIPNNDIYLERIHHRILHWSSGNFLILTCNEIIQDNESDEIILLKEFLNSILENKLSIDDFPRFCRYSSWDFTHYIDNEEKCELNFIGYTYG